MSNVLINGLTAVHKGSNGTLTTVDVCKTPSRCPSVVYTNIAKSTDSAKTASSINVNGNPVCNLTSNFAVSSGDEGGSCGGVQSGTVKGMAEFIMGSPNVFFEGIPAVRQTDLMISNNKNTPPMPLQQPGAGTPSDVSPEDAVQLEAAELPFVVDIEVAGKELKLLKSIIGAVDLELAPDEITGEPARLEKYNVSLDDTTAEIIPLTRKLLVKSVCGPTSLNLGDTATYTVTKTNLPDPTSDELQHVNWQIKSADGKILKEFKKHGPTLEMKIDEKLQGETYYVMPYINSPVKSISVKSSIPAVLTKGEIAWGAKVSTEFKDKVIKISAELGFKPDYLMACMAFETGYTFSPSKKNGAGSSGTGLIQFMKATAESMGTTTTELAAMTAVKQLDYVRQYFLWKKNKLKTLEDVYFTILFPAAIGKSGSDAVFTKGDKYYNANKGLDKNKNGIVTADEVSASVRAAYNKGLKTGYKG